MTPAPGDLISTGPERHQVLFSRPGRTHDPDGPVNQKIAVVADGSVGLVIARLTGSQIGRLAVTTPMGQARDEIFVVFPGPLLGWLFADNCTMVGAPWWVRK